MDDNIAAIIMVRPCRTIARSVLLVLLPLAVCLFDAETRGQRDRHTDIRDAADMAHKDLGWALKREGPCRKHPTALDRQRLRSCLLFKAGGWLTSGRSLLWSATSGPCRCSDCGVTCGDRCASVDWRAPPLRGALLEFFDKRFK